MERLSRGTQIVYVPHHLKGKPIEFGYPSGAQPGFVTSGPNNDGDYFCRYWILKGDKVTGELRTKAGSELTPVGSIVVRDTLPQVAVLQALKEYC